MSETVSIGVGNYFNRCLNCFNRCRKLFQSVSETISIGVGNCFNRSKKLFQSEQKTPKSKTINTLTHLIKYTIDTSTVPLTPTVGTKRHLNHNKQGLLHTQSHPNHLKITPKKYPPAHPKNPHFTPLFHPETGLHVNIALFFCNHHLFAENK